METSKNKKNKNNIKVEQIKYNPSKLEKTLKLSNDKLIAEAIQDILKRDNQNGN